jgi:type IV pilus assembly protein PilQ
LTLLLALAVATTSACATGAGGAATEAGTAPAADATTEAPASTVVTRLSAEAGDESVVVTLEASGPISYTAFELDDPKRIIIDMTGVDLSDYVSTIPVDHALAAAVRPYYFAASNDSRVEIDLNEDVAFTIDDTADDRLVVTVRPDGSAMADVEPMAAAEPMSDVEPMAAAEPMAAVEPMSDGDGMDSAAITELIVDQGAVDGPTRIVGVGFEQKGGMARIVIDTTATEPAFELLARKKFNRLTVDLPGALIAPEDERVISVTLDESSVKNVAAFQFRKGNKPLAKVVVNLEEMQLYNIYRKGSRVVLDIGDEAILALASEAPQEERIVDEGPIGTATENFTGAPISLDFQRADIHNILRILADVSGFNIITSDSVKGTVTMKLKNVPWDQALDVILRNNGLDKIQEGNIIRVATREEIQKENEAQERMLEAEKKISPLFTQVIEVNYESAESMKSNLESIKSERGSVDINARTNTLIVKDTQNKIAEMVKLIEKLDKRESQVLIESRIVEVTHSKTRELGVQWGGFNSSVTGNVFPNTIGVTGGIAPGGPNAPQGGMAVNTAGASIPTAAIGITLGHINGAALLDAKLMAMEDAGDGRIVSMPKITTMNNKKAVIESGQEVPYQTTSSDGTKTEFKKATLRLEVVPHVTPNDFVRLEIAAHKDEADFANTTNAGPPIRTKRAETEVLVADGDTAVLGGLFSNTDQDAFRKVPGLGDVPLLGWLFKGNTAIRNSEELLIFITPKVLQ